MSPEMEIVKNVDFESLNCKYLFIGKTENVHMVKNYIKLQELTEIYLNDILSQYKDDKDYVIEHLFISEMKKIEGFTDKLLQLRRLYSLTVCQITIRLPKLMTEDKVLRFAENILKDENYILLNVSETKHYTE